MDYSRENNTKRRKSAKSKRKKAKNKVGVIVFRVFVAAFLIGCFAMGGAAVGAYIGIIEMAPALDSSVSIQPVNFASIVYDAKGNEVDRFSGEENREYVALEDIPENLKNAFIAIEDERFYSHNGVDVKGMGRAAYSTIFQGDRQGASTLTQQLIKNNITKKSRNDITSKLQEQYLAVKYEALLEERLGSKEKAKDYILEAYLNTIGLHHGLNGVKTAASYYFNEDVSNLTLPQCAILAAITQIPAYYTPAVNPENNKVRQRVVLGKMLDLGFITQAEYDQARAEEDAVYERIGQFRNSITEESTIHSYYSDQLIDEIADALEEKGYNRVDAVNLIYNGGLTIETPMDSDMQRLLETTFNDDSFFSESDYKIEVTYTLSVKNLITDEISHYEETGFVYSESELDTFYNSVEDKYLTENTEIIARRKTPTIQPQAAMIIIDPYTGHVKALIGGRGEKTANRGFNRATQSSRQPGSVFKILASYAPALDMGVISPGSIIDDSPLEPNKYNYQPQNWNFTYKGPTTAREGVMQSMNVVTVKIMMQAGVEACYDYLKQFGFTTLVDMRDGYTDIGPATALGGLTDGVTQLEVTAAYATIANGGTYLKPTFYTKVIDHNGEVLLEYNPDDSKREVLKKSTAYMLTDMMQGVITGGTGTRARFTNVNMPVAGKTGTSQNTKDLTFVGYTPYYVAGIWLGHDKGDHLRDGASYHLSIWKYVMETIHENLEYKAFEKPDGLIQVSVCMDSGLKAVPGLCDSDVRGSRIRSDFFSPGSAPTESCNVHASVVIDTFTGKLADASTPDDRKMTVIGVVTPDSDVTSNDFEIPESMLNPGSDTKLNENYTGIDLGDDYYIDPDTGQPVKREEEEEQVEHPPFIDFPSQAPAFPTWGATVPNPTPTPTPQPAPDNSTPAPSSFPNTNTIIQPPQFSDIPDYPEPSAQAEIPPVIDTSGGNSTFGIDDPEAPPVIDGQ